MSDNAFSMDGRTFSAIAPISRSLPVGAYVRLETDDGQTLLGQVIEQSLAEGGPDRLRAVTSSGNLLATVSEERFGSVGRDAAFGAASATVADEALVASYLEQSRGKATGIELGTLRGASGGSALLNAAGFGRHTFLCGQSGSGKTYTLGVVLERLLLETDIRIVVADPNSDFVHIAEPRRQGDTKLEDAEYRALLDRFDALKERIQVAGGPDSELPLRAWFSDLSFEQQTTVLGLDPFADPDEYYAFVRTVRRIDEENYGIDQVLREISGSFDDSARRLGLRIANLGVAELSIWAGPDRPPTRDSLSPDWRMLVVDLGGVPTYRGSSIAATALLGNLWRQRHNRTPTLLVVDEAHNVCPRDPSNAGQALAVEHLVRIAGEGRKYGLYLLLASQRPSKIHMSVLSQCDNLLLMRMNSASDIRELGDTFSFAPAGLLDLSAGFRLGEGLAVGAIAPDPLLFASGARYTEEGGSDVPSTWAYPNE